MAFDLYGLDFLRYMMKIQVLEEFRFRPRFQTNKLLHVIFN